MCTGLEWVAIASIIGTSTAVSVAGQQEEVKARKKAGFKAETAETERKVKGKQALVTREQSLAKTRGTAEAAAARTSSASAAAADAQQSGTTLGNDALFKRVLG